MPFDQLYRREIMTLLGGAAAWPLAARAQQAERIRRIGMLIGYAENDPETQARLAAFRQALEPLGWKEGRSVRIDYRFAPASPDQAQVFAKELVALRPDVLVGNSLLLPLRCWARRAPCQSYSWAYQIPWAATSLPASLNRAAA